MFLLITISLTNLQRLTYHFAHYQDLFLISRYFVCKDFLRRKKTWVTCIESAYGGGEVDGWVKQTVTQKTAVCIPCKTKSQHELLLTLVHKLIYVKPSNM